LEREGRGGNLIFAYDFFYGIYRQKGTESERNSKKIDSFHLEPEEKHGEYSVSLNELFSMEST
jgi:hypothetical protein